jgi:hypothetical protein
VGLKKFAIAESTKLSALHHDKIFEYTPPSTIGRFGGGGDTPLSGVSARCFRFVTIVETSLIQLLGVVTAYNVRMQMCIKVRTHFSYSLMSEGDCFICLP